MSTKLLKVSLSVTALCTGLAFAAQAMEVVVTNPVLSVSQNINRTIEKLKTDVNNNIDVIDNTVTNVIGPSVTTIENRLDVGGDIETAITANTTEISAVKGRLNPGGDISSAIATNTTNTSNNTTKISTNTTNISTNKTNISTIDSTLRAGGAIYSWIDGKSNSSHDHGSGYASTGHTHSYAPVHDHPYASSSHGHGYASVIKVEKVPWCSYDQPKPTRTLSGMCSGLTGVSGPTEVTFVGGGISCDTAGESGGYRPAITIFTALCR